MEDNFTIFTESNEDMGVLYDSYKGIPGIISRFLSLVEEKIDLLIKDPKHNDIDLSSDINKFKSDVNKKFTPAPIQLRKIKSTKASITSTKNTMDKILNEYAKVRNRVSFGGNYLRAIINRPKVYSKEVDYDSYTIINKNIRNIDRALDWIEKIIIDMFNMVDQDLNILLIVDKVYNKHHIYESSEEDECIKGVGIMENSTGINGDDLDWIEQYLIEEGESFEEPPALEEDKKEEPKSKEEKQSMPKKTDAAESSKNGVRRKKLYIAFIEWCKEYNNKNTFGSIFDKDVFNVSYPFVPEEMRYFYRLANPMLCVLAGNLTFFPVAELRKLNSGNSQLSKMMVFAATDKDMRVFNRKDKKVYRGEDNAGALTLKEVLGDTFDMYIQNMINKGDILNAPLEDEATETKSE